MTTTLSPPESPLSAEAQELLIWAYDHGGNINFADFMEWKASHANQIYRHRRQPKGEPNARNPPDVL